MAAKEGVNHVTLNKALRAGHHCFPLSFITCPFSLSYSLYCFTVAWPLIYFRGGELSTLIVAHFLSPNTPVDGAQRTITSRW